MKNSAAFTLIELLVSVAIVGILAALGVGNYQVYRDQAKGAASITEISSIKTIVEAARMGEEKVLLQITGNGCTECSCRSGDIRNNSGACYTTLRRSMTRIFAAADMSEPSDSILRDGWGSPYLVDENEGEGGCNRKSDISSAGPDGRFDTDDDLKTDFPFSGYCD